MWSAIFEALKAVWDWFVSVIVGFGQYIITKIVGLLPATVTNGFDSQTSTIGFALSATNAWVPLDYAVTLAGLYITFVLGFLAIKVIVKLIP